MEKGLKPEHSLPNLAEIAQGMVACRSNALELIEESSTLSAGFHFARAYFLLHTACEELAKFSILELGGKRVARGDPPPGKRFWQRFRSHDAKTAQLSVQLLYLMIESPDVVDHDIVAAVDTIFAYGLSIRNSALYVDTEPGGRFRKPNDIDFRIPITPLETAAKLALAAADRRGRSVKEIERSLLEPPSQSVKDNSLIVLTTVIQRLKDAGLTQEDVTERLKKFLGR